MIRSVTKHINEYNQKKLKNKLDLYSPAAIVLGTAMEVNEGMIKRAIINHEGYV